MTEADRARFGAGLIALLEVFNREMSHPAVELIWQSLSDIPIEDVQRAMKSALMVCKFMPTPAELRELAGHGAESKETAIERAWQSWKSAVAHHGAYWSVVFEDGAVARAIIAVWGSWPNACLAEHSPEMWASKRKEFERAYVLQDRAPMALAGLYELNNRRTRGSWRPNAIEPPQSVAVIRLDGSHETPKLSAGSNPLSLLGGDVPALPAHDAEPAPSEAADIISRLKAEVARRRSQGVDGNSAFDVEDVGQRAAQKAARRADASTEEPAEQEHAPRPRGNE